MAPIILGAYPFRRTGDHFAGICAPGKLMMPQGNSDTLPIPPVP
jgi:hypothetical protein